MPYSSNSELPSSIKVLPSNGQSIWRNTFNSVSSKGGGEDSARKQAWGAVKNAGYHKNNKGDWVKKTKEEAAGLNSKIVVKSVDESLGIVFGWGLITDINGQPYYDTDNLQISGELMVKATSIFMEDGERLSNDSHTPEDIGKVVHGFPLSKEIAESMGVRSNVHGWMVGVKPTKEILAKFASGEYTGFSIEGIGDIIDEEE